MAITFAETQGTGPHILVHVKEVVDRAIGTTVATSLALSGTARNAIVILTVIAYQSSLKE